MYNKTANTYSLQRALKKEGISIPFPLYHSTSAKFVESILTSGLKARAGGPKNDAYWGNAICLSRNLDFLLTDPNFGAAGVILVLDRNEIKNKFKTHAYDYFHDRDSLPGLQKGRFYTKHRLFEFEERVTDKKKSPSQTEDIKDLGETGDYCLPKEVVIAPKYIKAVVITQSVYLSNYEYWDELDSHIHVFIRKGKNFKPLDKEDYNRYSVDIDEALIRETAYTLLDNLEGMSEGRSRYPGYRNYHFLVTGITFPNDEMEIIEQLVLTAKEDTTPEDSKLYREFNKTLLNKFGGIENLEIFLSGVDIDKFDYDDDGNEVLSHSPTVFISVYVDEDSAEEFEDIF